MPGSFWREESKRKVFNFYFHEGKLKNQVMMLELLIAKLAIHVLRFNSNILKAMSMPMNRFRRMHLPRWLRYKGDVLAQRGKAGCWCHNHHISSMGTVGAGHRALQKRLCHQHGQDSWPKGTPDCVLWQPLQTIKTLELILYKIWAD